MKYHNIKIRGRTCSCDDKRLVQGTVGQDAVTLDLDEEWNGLEVTVTFVSPKGSFTPRRAGRHMAGPMGGPGRRRRGSSRHRGPTGHGRAQDRPA